MIYFYILLIYFVYIKFVFYFCVLFISSCFLLPWNVNQRLTEGGKRTRETERNMACNDYSSNVEGLIPTIPPSKDYFLSNRGLFSRIDKRRGWN